MTLRKTATKPRQRWALLIGAVAALTLAIAGVSLAVHDEDFQLDGDVDSSTQTTVGDGGPQTVDWDQIITAAGVPAASLPPGFEDAAFRKDFNHSGDTFLTFDNSTYATGSKDTLPISGWQCNRDNNVNGKIDVMNAYTTAYTNADGDDLIYFALERFTNTGTANVAFWFLQDEVGCESPGGAVTFTGAHVDGDVLVVSEFSNGGVVSTINVYRWDGGANGSLNPTPIGVGVDCRAENLLPDDEVCAASNRTTNGVNGTITTPWLTANKADGVGNELRTSEFFEGGINLTDLNLGGRCFSSFLGNTRSSTSLTATLFDFAGGTIGSCEPGMTTQASTNGTVLPGAPVTDTATITITGADNPDDPTGDVTFFLCGPIAAGAECATGGTNVGTGTLDGGTITDDGIASATSPQVNTAASKLAAGHYCFRAVWPGDSQYDGTSHTNAVSECFDVADTSSGSTAQRWLPNDSATFSSAGGTNLAGSVQFTMYASANCTGTILFQETRNLVGGASSETVSTTNGDGAPATGLAADKIFTVANSPVTISWSAVFTSSNPSAVGGSTAPCETSSLTIDNDITVP